MNQALSLAEIHDLVHACHDRLGRPLSADELDDVVQETACTLHTGSAAPERGSSTEGWAYGIARNLIRNALRRRTRRRAFERTGQTALIESTPDSPDGTRDCDSELIAAVRGSLRDLGTTIGLIVSAHHGNGQPFASIARDLRLSPSAVKGRYYRMLPRLRKRLRSLWYARLTQGHAR